MSSAVALLHQRKLAQARAALDAQRLAHLVQQAQGEPGVPGAQGERGDTGPMPAHEWRGTQLRFEKPDGTWGDFVELRGPKGARGDRGASGGGGGSSSGSGFDPSGLPMASAAPLPAEVIVQQGGTWVRATWTQMLGWIGAVPPSGGGVILTEDGLGLLAEDGATLVTESATPPTAAALLTEDSGVLLTEDANRLEME